MQQITGKTVKIAFVDQGYTGEQPAADAADESIQLDVVKLPQAKVGFRIAASQVGSRAKFCKGWGDFGVKLGIMSVCPNL